MQYNEGEYAEAIASFAAFDEAFANSPLRPQAVMTRGWAHYRLQQFEQAAFVFTQAANLRSGADAYLWLGLSRAALGDHEQAAAACEKALARRFTKEADRATSLMTLAESRRQLKQLTEAEAAYQAIIARHADSPQAPAAHLALVRLAAESNDWRQVLERTDEFVRRYPQDERTNAARRIAVRTCITADKRHEAVARADSLPTGEESTAIDRLLRASAWHGVGRHAAAAAELEAVRGELGDEAASDLLLLKGSVYTAVERWEEAVAAYERHRAEFPAHTEQHERDAAFLFLLTKNQRGAEAAEVADDLQRELANTADEKLVSTLQAAAETAYRDADFTAAARLFSVVESIAGREEVAAAALSGKAWSLRDAGESLAAGEAFSQLIAEYPHTQFAAEAVLPGGKTWEQVGAAARAVGVYTALIDRADEDEQIAAAALQAARASRRMRAYAEAEKLYATLDSLSRPPIGRAELNYEWAWLRRDAGDEEGADALFARIVDDHPDSERWGDAAYRRAAVLAKSDPAAARRLLQEVATARANETSAAAHAWHLLAQIAIEQQAWRDAEVALLELLDRYPNHDLAASAEFWLCESEFRLGKFQSVAKHAARIDPQRLDRALRPLLLLRRAQAAVRLNDLDDCPIAGRATHSRVSAL